MWELYKEVQEVLKVWLSFSSIEKLTLQSPPQSIWKKELAFALFLHKKRSYFPPELSDKKYPDHGLQNLRQSHSRPQAQFGAEEVEGVHEAEPVQETWDWLGCWYS